MLFGRFSCPVMASIALSRDGSAFAIGRPDSAVSIYSLDVGTTVNDNSVMEPRLVFLISI